MISLYGRNLDGSAVRTLPPFGDRLPVFLGVLSQANYVRTMNHSLCRVNAGLKLTHLCRSQTDPPSGLLLRSDELELQLH